jgi:hypothetical protein
MPELHLALKTTRILDYFLCFRLLHHLRFRNTLLSLLLVSLFVTKAMTLALILLALFVIRKQVLTCLFSNPENPAIFFNRKHLKYLSLPATRHQTC